MVETYINTLVTEIRKKPPREASRLDGLCDAGQLVCRELDTSFAPSRLCSGLERETALVPVADPCSLIEDLSLTETGVVLGDNDRFRAMVRSFRFELQIVCMPVTEPGGDAKNLSLLETAKRLGDFVPNPTHTEDSTCDSSKRAVPSSNVFYITQNRGRMAQPVCFE